MYNHELRKLKFEGYQQRYINGEPLMTDDVFVSLLIGLGYTRATAYAELAWVKELKEQKRIQVWNKIGEIEGNWPTCG